MNKSIFIMIIIILLMAGAVAVIYFYYEKPGLYEDTLTNVSIGAYYQGKLIKTGIQINEESYNTSSNYELIKLRQNTTYIIRNFNLENQTFYQDEHEFKIEEANQRVDIYLDKPEKLVISSKAGYMNFNVSLYSKNFKEIDFCLKGSLNYLFIKAQNYTEMQKPDDLRNYDRCYDGNFSLEDSWQDIIIEYSLLDYPSEKDYLNITIFDKGDNRYTKELNI